ncbi:MAG: outer membrane protein assembly factor BamE [Kiritimatiellae bacterium]|nr:outer membrane protein assembly factor BamE [Kiritimatiellia bacterium]MDD5523409.1 outer membrane protein assembly factor BamE [Kiritimatiellia bacterium]
MKKIIICIIVLCLTIAIIPVVRNELRYGITPFQAFAITIMDDTVWSPGYTTTKFRSIQAGMTTADVSRILGPSLVQTEYESMVSWHYTMGKDGRVMSSSSCSTHERIVHFNTNGIVTHTTYDFYFD